MRKKEKKKQEILLNRELEPLPFTAGAFMASLIQWSPLGYILSTHVIVHRLPICPQLEILKLMI